MQYIHQYISLHIYYIVGHGVPAWNVNEIAGLKLTDYDYLLDCTDKQYSDKEPELRP